MKGRRPPLRSERTRALASLAAAGMAHLLLVLVGALSSSTAAESEQRAAALELTDDAEAAAAFLLPTPQQLPGDSVTQLVRSVPVQQQAADVTRPLPSLPGASHARRVPPTTGHRLRGARERSAQELTRASSKWGTSSAAGSAPGAAAEPASETAARGPRLIAAPNPCGSFFPRRAACDLGLVTLALQVTAAGGVAEPRVLSESPTGQGFAEAARLCTTQLRFLPALDAARQPIAARSVVRLRFAR
jgi:hypothetical protein